MNRLLGSNAGFLPVLTGLLLLQPNAQATATGQWSDEFFFHNGVPTVFDGTVRASCLYEGDLVVSGSFTDRILRLTDTGWTPMGQSQSIYATAMVVFNGDLYAGNYRWDGSEWHDVFQADRSILTMVVHDGILYAGGSFWSVFGKPFSNVFAWDGTSIHDLGGGVSGGTVYALKIHDGLLYAGGTFTEAGEVPVDRLACWNGSIWQPVGGGVAGVQESCCDSYGLPLYYPPHVGALYSHAGDLYVGGRFTLAGGDSIHTVARWDGAAWSSLGSGISGDVCDCNMGMECYCWSPHVAAFAQYRGDLIAAGAFERAGSNWYSCGIARWDGEDWHDLDAAFPWNFYDHPIVETMITYNDLLVVGGSFYDSRLMFAQLAAWNGIYWNEMPASHGLGLNDAVLVQRSLGDSLVVGGRFSMAGNTGAKGIASFTGDEWHALGGGLSFSNLAYIGIAYDIAVFEGDLLVGGRFELAGGVPALNVARWDGGQWHPLGEGIPDPMVLAVAVHDGTLYAGSRALPNHSAGLYSWNGSSWIKQLEVHGPDPEIASLNTYGDDLVVAGSFESAGALYVANIVLWNGNEARALSPENVDGKVRVTGVLAGDLIVGGGFWSIGGLTMNYIARWNGETWSRIGTSLSGLTVTGVYDLVTVGQQLFIGGHFQGPSWSTNWNVAMWDGVAWHTFDGGAGLKVYSVSVFEGDLYVGGDLAWTGPVAVDNFGRWRQPGLPVYLVSLEAVRERAGARIDWEVASGAVAGSHLRLWREDGDGARIPICQPVPMEQPSGIFRDHGAPNGRTVYWLEERETSGMSYWLGSTILAAKELPDRVALLSVHPNPFNPSTTISFAVDRAQRVSIHVLDVGGRRIATLVERNYPPGTYTVEWDGRDSRGRPAAAGNYIVRLQAPGGTESRKIALIR